MDLAKVFALDKTETIKDEFNGEKYSVTVKAKAFTQDFFQAYKDASSSEKPAELARILSQVVVSWDIEMNKKPFPPTYENLLIIPSEFLWHLISVIVSSWNGNEEDKKK